MPRSLYAALTPLVLAAFLAAGCGDEENGDRASGVSTPAPSTVQTTTPTGEDSDAPDVSDDPRVKDAVEQCKAAIAAVPTGTAKARKQAEALCDEVARGATVNVAKVLQQICESAAKAQLPEKQRKQADAACNQAGG